METNLKRFIFIITLSLLCLSLSSCIEKSNGEKVGYIVKLASEGLIVKTFECELIRGGLTNGSGTMGKSFHFTIEDPEVISIAKNAFNSQKEIKIKYHVEGITAPWRAENQSEAFVDNIEIL